MARGFRSFRREPSNSATLVTYYVDSGVSYTEKVASGKTVLSPTTFTPTKSGYSFLGWREDSVASSEVLVSKTAKGKTLSLYAVFTKAITVTYYNGSATVSTDTKNQYYNNTNTLDPTFQIAQAAVSAWTARGWTTSSSGGESAIAYANDTPFTRSSDVTLYGCYYRTVTLSYDGNGAESGSTAASTGTAYYHSTSGVTNASIALSASGFAKSNYIFAFWSTDPAASSSTEDAYDIGTVYSTANDTIFYAVWLGQSGINRNFVYTGIIRNYNVYINGVYKLEVYGGKGGNMTLPFGNTGDYVCPGGKGGYSVGYATLTRGQILYVVVGGSGANNTHNGGKGSGGYNGGGTGGSSEGAGGGGATHIGTVNALLSGTPVANLLIAAGGGGGAGMGSQSSPEYMYGGAGGGTEGGAGYGAYPGGGGGTQSGGGAGYYSGVYGQGGSASQAYEGGGGGGGYYGGGAGGNHNGSLGGGGGSGYIGGVSSGSMSSDVNNTRGRAIITFVNYA